MIDFETGKLYRVTHRQWTNSRSVEFIEKLHGWLGFKLAHPYNPEALDFKWYIRPRDILQARELTAEEVKKLQESTP